MERFAQEERMPLIARLMQINVRKYRVLIVRRLVYGY